MVSGDFANLVEKKGAAAGRFDQTGFAGDGARKCSPLVTKELAFEERLGNTRTINGDKRRGGAATGLVQGIGHQLLSTPRLPFEKNHRLGFRDARDERQHPLKRRRTSDQPLPGRKSSRLIHANHLLDEIGDFSTAIADRREFNIDVLLAARCVVQVQDTLQLPRFKASCQRASFAGLIAWHGVAM